jgi:small subunit ribosomal protein S6
MARRQPNHSFPLRVDKEREASSEERNTMRDYELTFIVRTLATDEEVNQAIDQVITYIELDDNGKVNSIDRKLFGRRRLAYEIDGQRDGHYVVMKASVDPDHILELETELKLFDPVLRYLLVRDEQKAKAPAE